MADERAIDEALERARRAAAQLRQAQQEMVEELRDLDQRLEQARRERTADAR